MGWRVGPIYFPQQIIDLLDAANENQRRSPIGLGSRGVERDINLFISFALFCLKEGKIS
jgi:hypothetical protein